MDRILSATVKSTAYQMTRKEGTDVADNKAFHKLVDAAESRIGKRAPLKPMFGVDEKVYEGVRIGLEAIKLRKAKAAVPATKTMCLNIDRRDQRLFTLPDFLDDYQATHATLALNGTPCVVGRDYTISGNILNWISDRKLYSSDAIAIRYGVEVETHYNPVGSFQALNGTVIKKLQRDLKESKADTKQLRRKVAELGTAVESLDTDYEDVLCQVGAIGESVSDLEDSAEELTAVEEVIEEVVATPAEEEEMIEQGVKVWHRLSGDGPWIVVQNCVLDINSRCEGGADNQFKKSYVELAWTVQTPDGVRDFPEVVLTTRKPVAKSMSWPKKIALGLGALTAGAAVIHAPLLLKLLGLLQ